MRLVPRMHRLLSLFGSFPLVLIGKYIRGREARTVPKRKLERENPKVKQNKKKESENHSALIE